MSHNNISIFVPHLGCPHKCSFCNQNSITGQQKAPTVSEVYETCKKAFGEIDNKENTEIAFFGGSFTAIPRKYMTDLLMSVQEFIGKNKFRGIRISTRPDRITSEILDILKQYNVTTIELGVQSMFNDVLNANRRGHTADDVYDAVKLIKNYGFDLGLQLMVGLYKSTPEKDLITAQKIADMCPSQVRIYPVVIMNDTELGELFKKGIYKPYSLDTAVDICCKMIKLFDEKNISIIKLGLHASEVVEENLLGGLYHPAFRELCDNRIFYNIISDRLSDCKSKDIIIEVAENALSKAIGQKKCNLKAFQSKGYKIKYRTSDDLNKYQIKIIEEECSCT